MFAYKFYKIIIICQSETNKNIYNLTIFGVETTIEIFYKASYNNKNNVNEPNNSNMFIIFPFFQTFHVRFNTV